MHIWPSMMLRESFKVAYLNNLERNLRRMKIEKQSRQSNNNNDNRKRLLDDDSNQENGVVVDETVPISNTCSFPRKAALLCGEILMVLSCCYCCFCCGACVAQDED